MINLSNCCSAEMKGDYLDMKLCPDCKEHCEVDIVEGDREEDERGERMLTPEKAEDVLAEIIDMVYLSMKDDFADYKAQTHKLGFFKENVKMLYHQKMAIYKLTGKLNY